MDTIEATRILLQDPRRAAAWLALADSYMDIYRDRPKGDTGLMLPQAQAWLLGVIEKYAEDLDGFIEFVRELRDHMRLTLKDEEAYIAMHKFYRSVLIRRIMQVRRARLDRALTTATRKYGEPSAKQRDTWLNRLEARWGRERLEYMGDMRAALGVKNLTTEQRADALEAFWKLVDQQIDEGNLPPWPNR